MSSKDACLVVIGQKWPQMTQAKEQLIFEKTIHAAKI
jgi:hypothetical protein